MKTHGNGRAKVLAAVAGVLAASGAAMADTPQMAPIAWPIDVTSMVTAITTAGVALIGAYFGLKIGFAFVKKLLRRLQGSV